MNIDNAENFLYSGYPWGYLMQIYCDHSVTTQAQQLKGVVTCLGLLPDRGNSGYDKESSGNIHVTSL